MTYKTFCIKKHWRETRQQFSGTPLVWRLLGKKPSFRFTPRVKWLKTPSPLGLSQPCPQPTLQPVAALNFSCYCRMVADAISKYHWEKCRGEEAGVEDMIERKKLSCFAGGVGDWGETTYKFQRISFKNLGYCKVKHEVPCRACESDHRIHPEVWFCLGGQKPCITESESGWWCCGLSEITRARLTLRLELNRSPVHY